MGHLLVHILFPNCGLSFAGPMVFINSVHYGLPRPRRELACSMDTTHWGSNNMTTYIVSFRFMDQACQKSLSYASNVVLVQLVSS